MFMKIFSKIREEVGSFSPWFKIALAIIMVIYFGGWIFTTHLSQIQKERGEEVVLPLLTQDSNEYGLLSTSIIENRTFGENGTVNTFRVPGYPIFVSFWRLIFDSFFFVTFIQIIMLFATTVIIRRIGLVFVSSTVGEIAAVLLLINPVTFVLTLMIFTDTLFLFLLLFGFYLAVSVSKEKMWPRILAASTLFAAAIYVRPMGIFALPIFMAPFLASSLVLKDKLKSIALMILVIAVLISPWFVRNYMVAGVADLSSFKSVNLAYYSVPMFLAHINNTSEEQERASFQKLTGVPSSEWRDIKHSKTLNDAASKILLSRPFSYLFYHVVTSAPFLFSSSIDYLINDYKGAMGIELRPRRGVINDLVSGDWRTFFKGIVEVWWKLAERIVLLVLYAFAAFGLWKYRRSLVAWSFACIALYLMLLAGPAASVRYALQAWPFIFLLSGVGMVSFRKLIKKDLP